MWKELLLYKMLNKTNNSTDRKFRPSDIFLYTFYVSSSLLLLYLLSKLFKKSLEEKKRKEYLNSLSASSNRLTYSKDEYLKFAQILYDAMSGVGTNEELIFKIIYKMKTKDDWNLLQKSFGVRKSYWFSGTLIEWLQDELNTEEFYSILKYTEFLN